MSMATPMPSGGLHILPRDLQKQDRIELPTVGAVLVLDVVDGGDFVWVTVSDGVRLVTTVRLHKRVPVRWFSGTVAREARVLRAVMRGLPWFALAIVVALMASYAGAPVWGGQIAAVIVLWLVGCVRMATTPEVTR